MGTVLTDGVARTLLVAALLPFLAFATRDFKLHLAVRRVPLGEHLVHLGLGVFLAATVSRALTFRAREFAFALLAFAVCGALDEFVFHRGLPAEEHDVHAKEHFALFVWVAVFCAVVQLRRQP
jgi:hypothetical protein